MEVTYTFKKNDTVRCLVPIQIPGWATVCTVGYSFTVEVVQHDGTLLLSRSGPAGKAIVKAGDVEPAYQIVGGLSYSSRTTSDVIAVLEDARSNRRRIRVHYGDRETGRDWQERYGVEGTVGTSTGPTKIPLMIHSRRSFGGPGLLDDCIVRITMAGKNGSVLYLHPTYHV